MRRSPSLIPSALLLPSCVWTGIRVAVVKADHRVIVYCSCCGLGGGARGQLSRLQVTIQENSCGRDQDQIIQIPLLHDIVWSADCGVHISQSQLTFPHVYDGGSLNGTFVAEIINQNKIRITILARLHNNQIRMILHCSQCHSTMYTPFTVHAQDVQRTVLHHSIVSDVMRW